MSLASGARLGTYEILASLGQGGMGQVYRARDTRLEREVALKLVHPHLLDAQYAERFQREARTLAAIGHPNIASIYELGEADGIAFIAMEFVPGETLADRLATSRLPIPAVRQIASQIAAALDAVHEKGIVHRDLKPSNIRLTPDGVVKVLDFGLAKLAFHGNEPRPDAPTATFATREGAVVGTAAYMSPEQMRGHEVDRRTDVWAFGCVLYEMLAGRRAFEGGTSADTIAAVIEREVDWSLVPAETPPELRRVLRRCLQRDVKQRLRDIGDARLELDETTTDSLVRHAGGNSKRIPSLLAAGLLAAGAVIGAIVVYATRAPAPDAFPAHFVVSPASTAPLGGLDFPSVAFAPDGSRIVYVANRGGQTHLFSRALNAIEPTPIAGTANATGPFFSPDSQWVAFFADGRLKKVAVAGGTPITLAEAPVGLGGSWGRNDMIVFAAGTGSGLSQISAMGGTPQRLTMLDLAQGEFSHRWPELLPDGETVLYTVGVSGNWSDAQIVAQSLTNGRRSVLVRGGTSPRYVNNGSLLFARNGRVLKVALNVRTLTVSGTPVTVLESVRQSADGASQLSVSASGGAVFLPGGIASTERRLVAVARDGATTPFAAATGPYTSPRVSPDGKKLLVSIDLPTPDLWVYDITAGTTSQLTFEAAASSPLWTRDARQAVFSSTRVGALNLFVTSTDLGRSERLAASPNQQFPGSWTPDGALVFTEQRTETGRDIVILPARDRSPRPLVVTPADETSPKVSPDGRWLAYVSNTSGRFEIYVTPMDNVGQFRLASIAGGTEPTWSQDGRELFYREGMKMMAVSAAGADAPSKPKMLFAGDYARGTGDTPNYDVMPDGRFVMVQPPRQQTDVAMHLRINWLRELELTSSR